MPRDELLGTISTSLTIYNSVAEIGKIEMTPALVSYETISEAGLRGGIFDMGRARPCEGYRGP